MQLLLSNLAEEFRRKGISFGLLPRLFADIEVYLKSKGQPSRRQLNSELEDFGWGISIIDQQLYEHILQVHQTHRPHKMPTNATTRREPGDRAAEQFAG